MSDSRNNPSMNNQRDNSQSQGTIRRYIHQEITINHYGIQATIKSNGRVRIVSAPDDNGEFDEIEISASLIFKLASLLKATRHTEYVTVASQEVTEPSSQPLPVQVTETETTSKTDRQDE